MTLKFKNIVVTGASRGLGKVIAQVCWRHGSNLLLVARSKEGLESLRAELRRAPAHDKQTAEICVADLSKQDAAITIPNKALSIWKAAHGLINNAGILGPIGKAWENDWREWEAAMRVNLFSPVELCRAFVPWMIQSGGGAIINLSGGGATGPRPNFSAYATAKTGLARFSETLAHELKGKQVRVNSVAPGAIVSDMLKEILDAGRERVGEVEYDKIVSQAKKGGTPPEKAGELCAFLISDQARNISGRIISAAWDPWQKLAACAEELEASEIYTLRRIVPEDRGKKWGSGIVQETVQIDAGLIPTEDPTTQIVPFNKIAVVGLWHLGVVTAACMARAGYAVTGFDENAETISALRKGIPPIAEPGLPELLGLGLRAKGLSFTSDLSAIADADIVWITIDTPVDSDDRAQVGFVYERVIRLFPYLKNDALVLTSSQLSVGSTRHLEDAYKLAYPAGNVHFAYSPENLRLGKAIDVFTKPDRIVAGVRSEEDKQKLATLFHPFTDNIIWMSVESAEMTKHAINAFLATSVVFINELGSMCERVGVDAREVERGLKSETRIGPRAYLKAGGAFAGGTLARDVAFLIDIGERTGMPAKLFSAVKASNDAHREWPRRKLLQLFGNLKGKQIAVLGLTYKPGTDTLRRSTALELCVWLHENGARVNAFDPQAEALPAALSFVTRTSDPLSALRGVDAAVLGTEWGQFKALSSADVINAMPKPILLDAGGFLEDNLGKCPPIRYYSVGRSFGEKI